MRSYESVTVRDGYLRLRGWIVLLGEREMVLKLLLPTLHSFAPHCKIKWSICIFRGWKSSTYFRFQEIGVKCSSVVEQMKLEDFLLPFETWFGSWWTCPEGEQLLELWTSAAWLLESVYFQSKNNHNFTTAFHSKPFCFKICPIFIDNCPKKQLNFCVLFDC